MSGVENLKKPHKVKVIRAQSAGFCWGVERAIDISREIAGKGQKVITDGPLIHNKQMLEKLKDEGIHEVGDYQSKSTLSFSKEDKENAVMVVRAHGISPERRVYLKNLGMAFKDATCPDVGIIAGKIRIHAKKGFETIIFGDPQHPEVLGLLGYAEGRGHVIQNQADIDRLPLLSDKVCMVSQSTMFTDEFLFLSEKLKEKYPHLLVFDTICGATKERQLDVVQLKQNGAQAIVVIGGRHSANTKKLAILAENQNLPTFHVETAEELDKNALCRYACIGVTAGASTPEFLIHEVCKQLESMDCT